MPDKKVEHDDGTELPKGRVTRAKSTSTATAVASPRRVSQRLHPTEKKDPVKETVVSSSAPLTPKKQVTKQLKTVKKNEEKPNTVTTPKKGSSTTKSEKTKANDSKACLTPRRNTRGTRSHRGDEEPEDHKLDLEKDNDTSSSPETRNRNNKIQKPKDSNKDLSNNKVKTRKKLDLVDEDDEKNLSSHGCDGPASENKEHVSENIGLTEGKENNTTEKKKLKSKPDSEDVKCNEISNTEINVQNNINEGEKNIDSNNREKQPEVVENTEQSDNIVNKNKEEIREETIATLKVHEQSDVESMEIVNVNESETHTVTDQEMEQKTKIKDNLVEDISSEDKEEKSSEKDVTDRSPVGRNVKTEEEEDNNEDTRKHEVEKTTGTKKTEQSFDVNAVEDKPEQETSELVNENFEEAKSPEKTVEQCTIEDAPKQESSELVNEKFVEAKSPEKTVDQCTIEDAPKQENSNLVNEKLVESKSPEKTVEQCTIEDAPKQESSELVNEKFVEAKSPEKTVEQCTIEDAPKQENSNLVNEKLVESKSPEKTVEQCTIEGASKHESSDLVNEKLLESKSPEKTVEHCTIEDAPEQESSDLVNEKLVESKSPEKTVEQCNIEDAPKQERPELLEEPSTTKTPEKTLDQHIVEDTPEEESSSVVSEEPVGTKLSERQVLVHEPISELKRPTFKDKKDPEMKSLSEKEKVSEIEIEGVSSVPVGENLGDVNKEIQLTQITNTEVTNITDTEKIKNLNEELSVNPLITGTEHKLNEDASDFPADTERESSENHPLKHNFKHEEVSNVVLNDCKTVVGEEEHASTNEVQGALVSNENECLDSSSNHEDKNLGADSSSEDEDEPLGNKDEVDYGVSDNGVKYDIENQELNSIEKSCETRKRRSDSTWDNSESDEPESKIKCPSVDEWKASLTNDKKKDSKFTLDPSVYTHPFSAVVSHFQKDLDEAAIRTAFSSAGLEGIIEVKLIPDHSNNKKICGLVFFSTEEELMAAVNAYKILKCEDGIFLKISPSSGYTPQSDKAVGWFKERDMSITINKLIRENAILKKEVYRLKQQLNFKKDRQKRQIFDNVSKHNYSKNNNHGGSSLGENHHRFASPYSRGTDNGNIGRNPSSGGNHLRGVWGDRGRGKDFHGRGMRHGGNLRGRGLGPDRSMSSRGRDFDNRRSNWNHNQ